MKIEDLTNISTFCINLTEQARKEKIDPVLGRDAELRLILQTLARRSKNNPLLLGDPGVGKTALANHLAIMIVSGDVPDSLAGTDLLQLDLASLKAGTGKRGDLEKRIKVIVEALRDSEGKKILFVDNIHVLLDEEDTANMLISPLSRGEIRVLGTSTLEKYKEVIASDKSLDRCFQVIRLEEPSVETTISILRSLRFKFERHHGIRILDSAFVAASKLSHRYIQDRRLPDKAIDLLDDAASVIQLESGGVPSQISTLESAEAALRTEYDALLLEGKDAHVERLSSLEAEISKISGNLQTLRQGWMKEKELHTEIKEVNAQILEVENKIAEAQKAGDFARVGELTHTTLRDLGIILGERHKMLALVGTKFIRLILSEEDIAASVSRQTGIPLERVGKEEGKKLLALEDRLCERVVGQEGPIAKIASSIMLARTGIADPNRPIGSFLLLGPTGVGKTELAKALAEQLFDDEHGMIRIDMSEFMEKHAVSRLVGSPPGYVGHEEGGQLTEAVRRKPFSVVLLDEVEKAHPDVWGLLLQVLDDGRLTDSQGHVVDFRNVLILMTSNLGSGLADGQDPALLAEAQKRELKKYFRPEFINRLDGVLQFSPLAEEHMLKVLAIQLRGLTRRLEGQGFSLVVPDEVRLWLAKEGYDPTMGARPLKRLIQTTIAEPLSRKILCGDFVRGSTIHVSLGETNSLNPLALT